MVFVVTAQTKKDSQAAHTDFTRSVYMESDTRPDNQTVLKKWKQKYGDDVDNFSSGKIAVDATQVKLD